MSNFPHNLVVFVSGFLASSVNAIAFGGSLISFPVLVWLGVPPIIANATNSAAMWLGSLGAVWGYRRELSRTSAHMYWLIVPSIVGSVAGAMLLQRTPADLFDRLVPLLILFSTVLFAVQERLQRVVNLAPEHHGSMWFLAAMVFQFLVSVYGGYFGAGMGILMLLALAILGHDDIHQMNGLKNMLALFINAVAAGYFLLAGMVRISDAAVMAAGAILGGMSAATLAQRMGRQAVRRAVIVIGFAMTLVLFLRL